MQFPFAVALTQTGSLPLLSEIHRTDPSQDKFGFIAE
jgi:hypothetical protein